MLCSEDFDAERQAKIEAEPPGDTVSLGSKNPPKTKL